MHVANVDWIVTMAGCAWEMKGMIAIHSTYSAKKVIISYLSSDYSFKIQSLDTINGLI